jgi:cytochrome-b5 reductase
MFARALDGKAFGKFRVSHVDTLNYNCKLISIEMPDQTQIQCSSCVIASVPGCVDAEGQPVQRKYTPISSFPKDGKFTFVVKGYESGKVSAAMCNLSAGDSVNLKGPMVKFPYVANTTRNLVFIAGGSGITPMLQIMQEVLSNPADRTQLTLIFCNRTEADSMLCQGMLSDIVAQNRLTIHHVLSQPSEDWKGMRGRVDGEKVRALLPEDSFVCVCGNNSFYGTVCGPKGPNFTQGTVGGFLETLGFTSDRVYKI